MIGVGTTRFANNLIIASSASKTFERPLINDNHANWSLGSITAVNGAVLTNSENATFTISAGNFYSSGSPQAVFLNHGLVSKTGSSTVSIYVTMSHVGTRALVTIDQGTLSLNGGGRCTGGGLYQATASGKLQFSLGTHILDGSCTLSGQGTIQYAGGT